LPAPLGPSRTKEGTTTEALWRYKIKWKMMGSDRASTKVKTMAPMVGLKLHVSHSRAVSMSTAIFVCLRRVEYEVAREAIQGIDRSNSRSRFPITQLLFHTAARTRTCRNLGISDTIFTTLSIKGRLPAVISLAIPG
jgi:hypothetical protein